MTCPDSVRVVATVGIRLVSIVEIGANLVCATGPLRRGKCWIDRPGRRSAKGLPCLRIANDPACMTEGTAGGWQPPRRAAFVC